MKICVDEKFDNQKPFEENAMTQQDLARRWPDLIVDGRASKLWV